MDIIYKAITSSGSDNINIKNLNEEVKENVYNIINKAYKYQNQLEIGNFSKDSDANITFYHCDGASYESEKALYEKIFGTKYTNQEFFELYEEELEPFMTEDGGFCPREANEYDKIKLKVHGVRNHYTTNQTLRRCAPHTKSFSRYAPSAFCMRYL